MKTTLLLIRHGQTEWNVARRMQGRMDSPLTPLGIEAAQQLAPTLPKVDQLYCSPSGRTRQTARILFGSQKVVCDDRLQEIDLGSWEGRLQAVLDRDESEQHHNFWSAPDRFVSPGGESFEQVTERSIACCRELVSRHPGETIAGVTHTILIRSFLFAIKPRPLADFWLPPAIYPASVSEVEWIDGTPRIVRFGCTAHHDHVHDGAY